VLRTLTTPQTARPEAKSRNRKPSRDAKSAAVRPLLRHRDTVTVRHDLEFRAWAMAPIADRFPLRNQRGGQARRVRWDGGVILVRRSHTLRDE